MIYSRLVAEGTSSGLKTRLCSSSHYELQAQLDAFAVDDRAIRLGAFAADTFAVSSRGQIIRVKESIMVIIAL